jgi:hypothetical protein
MALGTLVNAVSRSPIERALWTPIALGLAVLCRIVAAWNPKLPARQPDRNRP